MTQQNGSVEEPYMTTIDISKYLQVHEMTVYRWFKKGLLPGFKIGGCWRTKKSVLDQFLEAKNVCQNPSKSI